MLNCTQAVKDRAARDLARIEEARLRRLRGTRIESTRARARATLMRLEAVPLAPPHPPLALSSLPPYV